MTDKAYLAHDIEAIPTSGGGLTHRCRTCGAMGVSLAPSLPCPGTLTRTDAYLDGALRARFFEQRYDDMRNRVERALDLVDSFDRTCSSAQTGAFLDHLRSVLEEGATDDTDWWQRHLRNTGQKS